MNGANEFQVSEVDEGIVISSPTLDAFVRKKAYVTGVAAGSGLDKQSGFRDAGYELDIVDWIMEPGSDEAHDRFAGHKGLEGVDQGWKLIRSIK